MNSAVETFQLMLAQRDGAFYGKCVYLDDYHLYILDEDERRYVLGNGRGEGVSDERDKNVQFMMIKETLGFETIEDGEYQLRTSKLDGFIKLNCVKLVIHDGWLVRAVLEEPRHLLGLTNTSAPEHWERVPGTEFNVRWLLKDEVTDMTQYWK